MEEIEKLVNIWLENEKIHKAERDQFNLQREATSTDLVKYQKEFSSVITGRSPTVSSRNLKSSISESSLKANTIVQTKQASKPTLPIPTPESLTALSPLIISILEANQRIQAELASLEALKREKDEERKQSLATKDTVTTKVAPPKTDFRKSVSLNLTPVQQEAVTELENKINDAVEFNIALKKKVIELEVAVTKQQKQIRKLKKNCNNNNVK